MIELTRLFPHVRKPVCLVLFVLVNAVFALGARGHVTHKQSACDYFVVEAQTGFDVLE